MSRTNFAPSRINGVETHVQNAAIRQLCEYPYFIFVALQDIEPGTEICVSYGPHYDYDGFMQEPAVRDFFCGLIKSIVKPVIPTSIERSLALRLVSRCDLAVIARREYGNF